MNTETNDGNNRHIKVTRNGPYLVSGKVPLSGQVIGIDSEGFSYEWREGRKYPPEETYRLCRCGQSKNKPYCDGNHITTHFDGTETANHEPYSAGAKIYHGPTLDLADNEILCSAARFCDRGGGIWKLTRKSDNPDSRSLAITESHQCPSGRLVTRDSRGKDIEPELEPSIVIVEDPQENMGGPIWVRGGIPIESADGEMYEVRNRVTLCRCGKSANNPFCDASHCQEKRD